MENAGNLTQNSNSMYVLYVLKASRYVYTNRIVSIKKGNRYLLCILLDSVDKLNNFLKNRFHKILVQQPKRSNVNLETTIFSLLETRYVHVIENLWPIAQR